MPKYTNHEILTKLIEDTDWYHINSNGELVLGATSDNALYKASDILTIIRDVSTTDVEPVRHGEWEESGKCSVCGVNVYDDINATIWSYYKPPYCPNCGAKMDGGSKNG